MIFRQDSRWCFLLVLNIFFEFSRLSTDSSFKKWQIKALQTLLQKNCYSRVKTEQAGSQKCTTFFKASLFTWQCRLSFRQSWYEQNCFTLYLSFSFLNLPMILATVFPERLTRRTQERMRLILFGRIFLLLVYPSFPSCYQFKIRFIMADLGRWLALTEGEEGYFKGEWVRFSDVGGEGGRKAVDGGDLHSRGMSNFSFVLSTLYWLGRGLQRPQKGQKGRQGQKGAFWQQLN